jgi:rod shape determining protein RodA
MVAPAIPRIKADAQPRDPASAMLHIDWTILAATLVLVGMGVLMVFSATRGPGGPEDPIDTSFVKRQAIFAGIGIVVMLAAAVVDYRKIRSWSGAFYLASIGLLVLVLSPLGTETKGTQAWFDVGMFQIQPSEFGKLALILALSAFAAAKGPELSIRNLAIALVMAGLPIGLILLQPDVGTVLVFVAITMGVLLVGGAKPRHIVALTLVGLIAIIGILNSDVLAEYQRERFVGFLDPKADVQDETYNQNNAQVAVGAGGITGAGLFEGRQNRSDAVPEQQTDFIFTVVGEELGFAGAATALLVFAFLLWRIWRVAKLSRDVFGMLICVGVLSMFLFQIFQSVGMSTGIMPVTGIPLPFMSYGGSSILTSFAAVGLVLNVHMRRFA